VNREHGEKIAVSRSETARKTSAREDIQRARADRLRRWREENPEAFSVCTEALLDSNRKGQNRSTVSSLEDTIWAMLPEGFRRNVQVRANRTVRQVDFVGPFMVEVDGLHHFRPIFGAERFRTTYLRDRILTLWAFQRRRMLIRLSLDVFTSSGALRPFWASTVGEILADPLLGVSLVGDLYAGSDWPADRSWTSRSGAITCSSSKTG